MKSHRKTAVLAALAGLVPSPLFACAACYGGNIDSPMTNGMNWGILTLMGVVLTVLASFLVFFIHIIRKGEALAAAAENAPKPTDV